MRYSRLLTLVFDLNPLLALTVDERMETEILVRVVVFRIDIGHFEEDFNSVVVYETHRSRCDKSYGKET